MTEQADDKETNSEFKKAIWKNTIKRIDDFLELMKQDGVDINVQFLSKSIDSRGVRGTLSPIEALGLIEYHKIVIEHGITAIANLDGLVQAYENNPELVKRLNKSMRQAEEDSSE